MSTTDMGLTKPSDGASNAGEDYNDDLDTIDAGRTYKITLGEAFSQYHVGYIASDGQAYLANAATEATSRAIGFITEAGDAAAQRYFRYLGRITNGDWSLTPGDVVYLNTSNGEITQTCPATPNYIVELGVAQAATVVFCRIPSYLEASAPNTQSVFKTINSDSGSTTADASDDTLIIAGGTGVDTSIAGDTVTIDIGQDVATDQSPTFNNASLNGTLYADSLEEKTNNAGVTIGHDVHLPDGVNFDLYEYIQFLGQSGEDMIKIPGDQAQSLQIISGATPQFTFDTTSTYERNISHFKMRIDGQVFIEEKAAADTDISDYGQYWVKDETPNIPKFTDDAGSDFDICVSGGDTGGSGSAGAGKQYVEISIGGTVFKILHDGTV